VLLGLITDQASYNWSNGSRPASSRRHYEQRHRKARTGSDEDRAFVARSREGSRQSHLFRL